MKIKKLNEIKHTMPKFKVVAFLIRTYDFYSALLFPQHRAKQIYRSMLKREPNFEAPLDINEKINYLKFHANMKEWAKLADKYYVRDYVKSRGLESILIPLYAKCKSIEELKDIWDTLPNDFIIKSNNGCGDNIVVDNKNSVDKDILYDKLKKWKNNSAIGVLTAEPHYTLLRERFILVEKLMKDECNNANSLIDYKIWCFNGKAFSILVCVDRDIITGDVRLDLYNTKWQRQSNKMVCSCDEHGICKEELPKPDNLNYMLECAERLAVGHPQCRVDLYNINGKIYFGEMTMTSQGGYMNYFTPEYLLEMGQQFEVK